MEIFFLAMALACSLIAYLFEERLWVTMLRTTDKNEFVQWCKHLEERGVEYHSKKRLIHENHAWVKVYKVKVPKEQASRVNVTYHEERIQKRS
ncbi:hypothetical protein EEL32_15700 [Brevibacillus laterosporus]|uniref:Uncharacterized protein n=1 Tax=Brevibacillus laterosporus TaxID=1465 RepID=A0A502IIA5_BRELA|nr:hypothetical protein [Brevibacillus laterosporus]QDX92348.1 hypothetical protein EEL30_08305 [Brevibacillus laterosporus]RAP23062.1 hypothetical protein C2W64_03161 [Brevibacillus laterosporus]TPG70656.1 hypothetical protein EEL31_20770 [Brevibacillus laterosporus]TPG84900.1 hypothetical protein EEL32_15700 [Brevibacillus laterosporus]